MDAASVKELQRLVEEEYSRLGVKCAVVEGEAENQTGDTLRLLLPVTEDGAMVLTELAVFRLEDELDLLTFYTTVLMNLEPDTPVAGALSGWNLTCPIGAFGILREEGRLFHKYTYPAPSAARTEDVAASAEYAIELIFQAISRYYGEALALAEAESE